MVFRLREKKEKNMNTALVLLGFVALVVAAASWFKAWKREKAEEQAFTDGYGIPRPKATLYVTLYRYRRAILFAWISTIFFGMATNWWIVMISVLTALAVILWRFFMPIQIFGEDHDSEEDRDEDC